MVGAVDHGHVDRSTPQGLAAANPPKAKPTITTRCLEIDELIVILSAQGGARLSER